MSQEQELAYTQQCAELYQEEIQGLRTDLEASKQESYNLELANHELTTKNENLTADHECTQKIAALHAEESQRLTTDLESSKQESYKFKLQTYQLKQLLVDNASTIASLRAQNAKLLAERAEAEEEQAAMMELLEETAFETIKEIQEQHANAVAAFKREIKQQRG